MSLVIADNFSYQGKKPLDARLVVSSLSDLTSLSEATIYDGILVYVTSEKKYYTYDSRNVSASGDKWKELTTGADAADSEVSVQEYFPATDYKMNTLVYNENKLARVVKDFTSSNVDIADINRCFEEDIANGNIILVNSISEPGILPYEQGKLFLKDKLVFADGRIGRVLNDYISDSTGNTIEESINIDIANGNLREMAESYKFKLYKTTQDMNKEIDAINELPISTIQFENGETIDNMHLNECVYGPLGTLSVIVEINKNLGIIKTKSVSTREMEFMPPAPVEHEVEILLSGVGYQIGDTVDSSLDEFSIRITEVDENGGITKAELIDKTTSLNATGYGALVDAKPVLYYGHAKKWYKVTSTGTSAIGTNLEEYVAGNQYKKDTLIYVDNVLYRAASDFTAVSLDLDITNGFLIRLTQEPQAVPECLGSVMSDKVEYLPDEAEKGNWVIIMDCEENSPGQPGFGLYNGTSWDIIPMPKGEMEFPEPAADGTLNFRRLNGGDTTGEWVPFTDLDGNDVNITLRKEDSPSYVPKANELVLYDGNLILGDGINTTMDIEPFYKSTITKEMIETTLGYTPEDSDNRGRALGYAPLDEDGLVPEANLPLQVTDTYSKAEIDQKDTDTVTTVSTLVNNEATRAAAKETEIENNLKTHIDDKSVHVTQTEKDTWDAKVDESKLDPFNNHITDTAIHVTQSDKDKWDGMNKAYFVTDVADLPAEGNQVGNVGYVQTSAPGVTPIACSQYLWNGTKWEEIDSSQISLSFKWDNLDGRPAATPLTLDNTVTLAHNHTNKTMLDKIGQTENGDFTWDGNPIGIRAVFLENQFGLPDIGQPDTLYIIYSDSRVRNFPSISVWKEDAYQVLGRGIQDAPPTVGEMAILQAEYFGVKANSTFTIAVTQNNSFCFLPVEVLKEIEGLKDQNTIVSNLKNSSEFLYNNQLVSLTEKDGLSIDLKSHPTTIDTVGNCYFSHVDVDLFDYKEIEGIE